MRRKAQTFDLAALRGRYIDLLLAKIEQNADNEPLRERLCDRAEAMLWPPSGSPPIAAPVRHPTGVGWIDRVTGQVP